MIRRSDRVIMLQNCIVITGSPGTGKTLISRILSKQLQVPLIKATEIVIRYKLGSYDPESDTYDVDAEDLRRVLLKVLNAPAIIDSVIPDILPQEFVELVVVLRLDPMILARRLIARNWKVKKILENVEAELLGIITYEAVEYYGLEKVVEIDTTGKSPKYLVEEIKQIIRTKNLSEYRPFTVDWLAKYEDPMKFRKQVLAMINNY